MTERVKIAVSAVLFVIGLACLTFFGVGCSKGAGGTGDGPDDSEYAFDYLPHADAFGWGQGGVVCTVSGFEVAKDDWFDLESPNVIGNKAKDAVVYDLVVGEKYYYIYTVYLSYSDLKNSSSSCVYDFTLSFSLQGAESYLLNGAAVDVEFVGYYEAGTARSTSLTIPAISSKDYTLKVEGKANSSVKTYAVISFIPKDKGELKISCQRGKFASAFYCNANDRATVESGAAVKIGGIRLYHEKIEDCPDGKLPDNYGGQYSNMLTFSMGQSYYKFIQFDIAPLSDISGKVYCAVTFGGGSVRFNLESSGTGDYKKVNGHDVFGFSVSGKDDKKTVTLCYEVVPLREGSSTAHVALFGDGVLLEGNARAELYFSIYLNTGSDEVIKGDGVLRYTAEKSGFKVIGVMNDTAKEITIPDSYDGLSVISIGACAFKGNENVKKIIFGSSITTVEQQAFADCADLEEVVFNVSLQSIGDSAFENCAKLKNPQFPILLKSIGENAFKSCGCINEISLPAQLETIGQGAFAETALKTVRIPASVKEIGGAAFYNCHSSTSTSWGVERHCTLTEITVSPSNNYFTAVDGVLFDKDMTVLLQYPASKPGKTYAVPDTVKEIAPYAFYVSGTTSSNVALTALQEISLPASVDKIGEYAFYCKYTTSWTACESYSRVNIAGDTDWVCTHSYKATVTLPASKVKESSVKLSGDYCDYTWTRKNSDG